MVDLKGLLPDGLYLALPKQPVGPMGQALGRSVLSGDVREGHVHAV